MLSFWPTIVVRNKYADADTVAPAAITPLMKLRRECPGLVAGASAILS
jgi:hypothetical protein